MHGAQDGLRHSFRALKGGSRKLLARSCAEIGLLRWLARHQWGRALRKGACALSRRAAVRSLPRALATWWWASDSMIGFGIPCYSKLSDGETQGRDVEWLVVDAIHTEAAIRLLNGRREAG